MTDDATPAKVRLTDGLRRCDAAHVCDCQEAARQCERRHEWVTYNPLTNTYDTQDGTSVSAELVQNVQCLADVLRIAQIRASQRDARAAQRRNNRRAASALTDVLGAIPPEPTFTEKYMNETTWKKEPAIEGKHGGCLNCGPRPSFFPPDGQIAVGFGYAALHKDGEPIYTEPNEAESEDDYMTGAKAEELAAADPDHDWRIVMEGPLSGRTYQRHAAGEWALIEQNQGFA